MSYNRNARVGSLRSNRENDVIAVLLRVDRPGSSQLVSRTSVLTVCAWPTATEAMTVQCHNGSITYAQEVTFRRRESGISQLAN